MLKAARDGPRRAAAAVLWRAPMVWRSAQRQPLAVVALVYALLLWRSSRHGRAWQEGSLWQLVRRLGAWRTLVALHYALFRYVVGKATLALLVLWGRATLLVPASASAFVEEQGRVLQESMQQRLEAFLEGQMDFLGDKFKDLVMDPYMPVSIQITIDDFVDILLPDVKLALFNKTNEYINQYQYGSGGASESETESKARKKPIRRSRSASTFPDECKPLTEEERRQQELDSILDALDESDVEDSDEGDGASERSELSEIDEDGLSARNDWKTYIIYRACPRRVRPMRRRNICRSFSRESVRNVIHKTRAWVLYTTSPYDRSFWRSIRNPYYIILQVVGLIPGIGMLWWLFVFLLHDKRDEFQLSQFIVGFQTAKFFSQGCFNLLRGAFYYYLCATKDIPNCEVKGPMVRGYLDAVFFFVQITLVWLTFFILPYSEPCRAVNDPKDAYMLDLSRGDKNQAALRAKVRLGRGGRLMHLFWWDTVSVFAAILLGVFAYAVLGQRGWQFRSTCYWLSTLYGLTALPFVPFKLPVMGNLLTPTKATGYTRDGMTVLRVIPPPPCGMLEYHEEIRARSKLVRRRSSSSLHAFPQGVEDPWKPFLSPIHECSPENSQRDDEVSVPPPPAPMSFFWSTEDKNNVKRQTEEEKKEIPLQKSFDVHGQFFLPDHYEVTFQELSIHSRSSMEPSEEPPSPQPTLSPQPSDFRNLTSAVAFQTSEASAHAANRQLILNLKRLRSGSSVFDQAEIPRSQ